MCIGIKGALWVVFIFITNALLAQKGSPEKGIHRDSVFSLPTVSIQSGLRTNPFQFMPEISGTSIYAGKKHAQILVQQAPANLSANSMRQVLAKIPGIHIWESDPSGIQTGIATRGLSPNRSWELNMRQNGYDIAADPYGYPEAYYTPPLTGVERIEVIRGQAALQYGPQMGGMVNYVLANGKDFAAPLAGSFQQTIGSFGRNHSFLQVGGKSNNRYGTAWLDYQTGLGGRQNSEFSTITAFGSYTTVYKQHTHITAEWLAHRQISQQPGGLTDAQFAKDPNQSFRNRNWMGIEWMIPALSISYQPSDQFRWDTKVSAIIGNRNSVGMLQSIEVADTIQSSTGAYLPRTVAIDRYRNLSLESKVLLKYQIAGYPQALLSGIRIFSGETLRLGNGKGSSGSDYQLNISGAFPQHLLFNSINAAAFLENVFQLNSKLKIIPGIRTEWIQTNGMGTLSVSNTGHAQQIDETRRDRFFLLAGLGAEYHISPADEIYIGWAQAYRPIQFSNLQASPIADSIDPTIQDAGGYNLDIGYRGKLFPWLQVDLGVFYMHYANRIGSILMPGNQKRLITNVGSSDSKGVELYADWNISQLIQPAAKTEWSLFASYSFTDARYASQHRDSKIAGNKVENAPQHIVRSGISYHAKYVSLTVQFSYVDETFSDANNSIQPASSGISGKIPSYRLWDITTRFTVKKHCTLSAGVNNILNESYFTRRASGYPGPGLLPAIGRNAFVTLKFSL